MALNSYKYKSKKLRVKSGIRDQEEQVYELKSKRYRSAIRRFVAVWPAVTVERTVSVFSMMW